MPVRREQLLQPGQYCSLPHAILARPDLPATAKLLALAMLDHLRNGQTWIAPPIERLMAQTASGRTAMKASITTLEAAKIIEADRNPGKVTRYRFCQTALGQPAAGAGQDGPEDRANPVGRNPTGPESDPAGIRPTPGRNPADTGSESDPPIRNSLKPTPTHEDPPNPPAKRGGDVRGKRKANPEKKPNPTAAALAEQIDAAHREVFDVGMPAAWMRKIRRECRHGDPALLAAIDAAAIRAGLAAANTASRTFGLGWVLNAARDAHADRRAAEKARRRRQGADRAAKARLAQVQAERRAKATHFAGLPEAEQKRLLTQAAAGSRVKAPKVVAQLAVELAWKQRADGPAGEGSP